MRCDRRNDELFNCLYSSEGIKRKDVADPILGLDKAISSLLNGLLKNVQDVKMFLLCAMLPVSFCQFISSVEDKCQIQ